jgi:hypothetical protein
MTDAVEKVARLLDPQSWLVMDEGLASMLRKHKGQNIGFDPENFKHPPSIKRANEIINTLETLGWLSPDQLAIRDAETTRRALEMAAKHIYDNFQDPIVYLAHDAILALQPAPTGWELVPDTAFEHDKDEP